MFYSNLVNCVWSEWGDWSVCSKTCEGGIKKSKRSVFTKAMHGGLDCTGDAEKEELCYPDPCPGNDPPSWIAFRTQQQRAISN